MSLTGQRDQKLISPTSHSKEVFLHDTSPLPSPYLSGSSIFLPSPISGKLKHSHSWGTLSPQGLKPCSSSGSRGLSSVEESGKWAEKEVDRLSPVSPEHLIFYKRTRPTKDSRELSSPKKTGETFPKAKEQHHTPKKTESQTHGPSQGRTRTSPTVARTGPVNPRKPLQGAQQVTSSPEHPQGPQRRLTSSSGRQTLDHNGKGANPEIRRQTQKGDTEARGDRRIPVREQKESFKKHMVGESLHHSTSPCTVLPVLPVTVREAERGMGKDSRQRHANGKPTEDKNTNKRESLLSFKDMWSRKGSVVSPKEAKGKDDTFSNSKEVSSKDGIVASINSIPETLQSPKGPLSPGPWKVPSSAKILSQAEVLRGPL